MVVKMQCHIVLIPQPPYGTCGAENILKDGNAHFSAKYRKMCITIF